MRRSVAGSGATPRVSRAYLLNQYAAYDDLVVSGKVDLVGLRDTGSREQIRDLGRGSWICRAMRIGTRRSTYA